MKKTLCKAKVWLIPVLAVLALCMCALAALLPTRANAEAPVYEITGFSVASTAGTTDTIYVNATLSDNNIEKTWHIDYTGTGTLNGVSKTVGFRIIPSTSTGWFRGIGASQVGDVFKVGGEFVIGSATAGETDVKVGDYTLNLEETEFVYAGEGVWEKAKEKVDELPSANIFLDANGTDLWLSGQVVGINDNTALDNWWGFLPGSDVNLKVSYTENSLSDGETIQVNFAKRYKASNFTILNVKMLVGTAAGVVNTAYATADTEFTTPAGATSTTNGTEVAVLNVEASKIADSEGYFDSFVIKRTGGSAGQVFVDYVELVPDMVYTDNLVLDANGTDVAIEGGTVAPDNTFGLFGDGSTQMIYTGGVASGSTLTVTLGKKYRASNFASLKVRMKVGSWGEGESTANIVTNAAYATADTEFANIAGRVQTGQGNIEAILEIDAATLADSEGFISSFVIRKTETFNVGGQMFFDYVELVVADLDDTEYKQNVVLDFTGTDIITSDNIKPKADVNGIFDSANEKVIGTTEMIGNNTVMSFTFAKKYKAANFQSVTIEYAVSDWTMGNKVTITAYALLDFDLVKPLKASTVDGYATRYDSLTMSSEELAGKDGYIRGLVLVKTQTGTEEVPDPKWQFFVNEITLNVPSYTMTIKDGDGTVTKNVVKGESFAVADIGAVNSATHIVAGYKINGKLYSGDYTFVPAENTEIEVVRVAFRVLDGAYIKYIGGTGLRFMLSLNEADYEAVKTLVSEGNISFGVIMIKIDSEGKDSKSMVKEAENYYVEDGTIKFNGVVTGFPETAEAYQTQFRAGGYLGIKYEDKTDATMIYADEPAAEYKIRSIYEVAKAAIKAGVTGEALVACENIVNTVENANSVLSATNLPDYNVKKKI